MIDRDEMYDIATDRAYEKYPFPTDEQVEQEFLAIQEEIQEMAELEVEAGLE